MCISFLHLRGHINFWCSLLSLCFEALDIGPSGRNMLQIQ